MESVLKFVICDTRSLR